MSPKHGITLGGKAPRQTGCGSDGFQQDQRLESTRQRIYNGSLQVASLPEAGMPLFMGKRVEGIEPS